MDPMLYQSGFDRRRQSALLHRDRADPFTKAAPVVNDGDSTRRNAPSGSNDGQLRDLSIGDPCKLKIGES